MILFDETEPTSDRPRIDPIQPATIKVMGIGGGGGNAVDRMIDAKLRGIEFMAANTDLQALSQCKATIKLQLGPLMTRGLGAGADPDVGRRAALEDTEKILEFLDGADMVFLTAGLGGGTGTGAAPIIASLAAEIGALTVAVVTKPFGFEGRRRMQLAEMGVQQLREVVDTVITIPNERLLQFVDRGTPLQEAFLIADDVLRQAVQGISDLITIPGDINADFADVKAIMSGMGMALMGTGIAKGENRALEAAQRAIASPLLEDTSIQGAKGVLINITGSENLTLHEVAEAANTIAAAVDPDANIISGLVIDPSLGDDMKVTVIATGFSYQPSEQPMAMQMEPVRRPVPSVAAMSAEAVARVSSRGLDDTPPELPERASFQPQVNERAAEPIVESFTEPMLSQEGGLAEVASERTTVERPPEPNLFSDFDDEARAGASSEDDSEEEVPFYRKALAHPHDEGGFGPNWREVDDYDIPTVLRKQMD
jgi:cell division protein FtsZ